jgi:hypothetical protein
MLLAMTRQVKLNTSGIKYTPSTFTTFYEVRTNFKVNDEQELLKLDEVKAVLNAYEPVVQGSSDTWSIAISTPLHEMYQQIKG